MQSFKHWYEHTPAESPVLRVNAVGVQEPMDPGIVDRPRGTGDFLFMFFTAPVEIEARGERLPHPAPTAMLWDHGAGHVYGNRLQPWGHSWIHALGTLVREAVAASSLPLGQPFPLTSLAGIDEALARLDAELSRHPGPDEPIAQCLFQCVVREVVRARPDYGPSDRVPPALAAVRAYLDQHFTHTVTLAELAGRAHMSVPHFCSEFKRWYGVPALEYTIARRLHLARYYLQDRSLRIQEVAERVGYGDLCYFSRLFKRRFGITPREARQGITD